MIEQIFNIIMMAICGIAILGLLVIWAIAVAACFTTGIPLGGLALIAVLALILKTNLR